MIENMSTAELVLRLAAAGIGTVLAVLVAVIAIRAHARPSADGTAGCLGFVLAVFALVLFAAAFGGVLIT